MSLAGSAARAGLPAGRLKCLSAEQADAHQSGPLFSMRTTARVAHIALRNLLGLPRVCCGRSVGTLGLGSSSDAGPRLRTLDADLPRCSLDRRVPGAVAVRLDVGPDLRAGPPGDDDYVPGALVDDPHPGLLDRVRPDREGMGSWPRYRNRAGGSDRNRPRGQPVRLQGPPGPGRGPAPDFPGGADPAALPDARDHAEE